MGIEQVRSNRKRKMPSHGSNDNINLIICCFYNYGRFLDLKIITNFVAIYVMITL